MECFLLQPILLWSEAVRMLFDVEFSLSARGFQLTKLSGTLLLPLIAGNKRVPMCFVLFSFVILTSL